MLHPFSPFGRRQPARSWAAVRALGPVYDDPVTGMALITGYRLCRAALTDAAFSAASGQQQRAREDDLPTSMLTTDGVAHRRLREAVSGAWSGRAAARRTDVLTAAARAGVAALPDSTGDAAVDLVDDFARPFAERALAAVLGLADDDVEEFGALAAAAGPNLDPLLRGPAAASASAASACLQQFLAGARDRGRSAGAATDLAGLDWAAPLSDPERLAYFSLLVVGGWEPLIAAVAGTVWTLLQEPESRAAVRVHPDLLSAAVDETLRLHSPIPFTARVCRSDFIDGDIFLPAGTPVLAVISAANRDPEVFAEPDEFRLDRPATPGHLAFGAGAHFCLGAPLVRLAAQTAVGALLDRHPALAPAGPVRWSASSVPRRLEVLPVTW